MALSRNLCAVSEPLVAGTMKGKPAEWQFALRDNRLAGARYLDNDGPLGGNGKQRTTRRAMRLAALTDSP
jgi:hypothetical protein